MRKAALAAQLITGKDLVEDVSLFPEPYSDWIVVAQPEEERALSLMRLEGEFVCLSSLLKWIWFTTHMQKRVPLARESSDKTRRFRGVSAVATLSSSRTRLSFMSAGYDHKFHLWSLDPDLIEQPECEAVNIQHRSLVQTLLNVDHYVLSGGADNIVQRWDLGAEAPAAKFRTSNSVYQLHRFDHPQCVLLEVSFIWRTLSSSEEGFQGCA